MNGEVGEVKKGNEVGIKSSHKFIWAICPKCQKGRWVQLRDGIALYRNCRSCSKSGADHPNWKGGKSYNNQGYTIVLLNPTDPYWPMRSSNNYVLEHRHIMAQHLGRCLLSREQVHHKNGNRSDNRIVNLELISPLNHSMKTAICSNCGLRKEVKLLQWQVRELIGQLQYKLEV